MSPRHIADLVDKSIPLCCGLAMLYLGFCSKHPRHVGHRKLLICGGFLAIAIAVLLFIVDACTRQA